LGGFQAHSKPGGYHDFSRTRKTSGTAGFLQVQDLYLNSERHETPLSLIIHS